LKGVEMEIEIAGAQENAVQKVFYHWLLNKRILGFAGSARKIRSWSNYKLTKFFEVLLGNY
jgi:hypothetical protein